MSNEQQGGEPVTCEEVVPEPVTGPKKLTAEEAEGWKTQAQESFDYFDLDKSGYIVVTEVENVLRKWNEGDTNVAMFTEEEIKNISTELFSRVDANVDAKISFDELYNAMLKEAGYEV